MSSTPTRKKTLQELIQQTRRQQHGLAPKSNSEPPNPLSSQQIQVKKTLEKAMRTSPPSSTAPPSSPPTTPRRGESFTKRRERVAARRRVAQQQKSEEDPKQCQESAVDRAEAEGESGRKSNTGTPEFPVESTPYDTGSDQASRRSPALKALLDKHEEQQATSSQKEQESARDSQSETESESTAGLSTPSWILPPRSSDSNNQPVSESALLFGKPVRARDESSAKSKSKEKTRVNRSAAPGTPSWARTEGENSPKAPSVASISSTATPAWVKEKGKDNKELNPVKQPQEEKKEAGINFSPVTELEALIDNEDWSAVIAKASFSAETEAYDSSDSDESLSPEKEQRKSWFGAPFKLTNPGLPGTKQQESTARVLDMEESVQTGHLTPKQETPAASTKEASPEVLPVQPVLEESRPKFPWRRPPAAQQTPSPLSAAADEFPVSQPPVAEHTPSPVPPRPPLAERTPSPVPNPAETSRQKVSEWTQSASKQPADAPSAQTVSSARPAASERITKTASVAGAPAPWARHVASEGTVTKMSPDHSTRRENVKESAWAKNATKEAPPAWPIEGMQPKAEKLTVSEASSANSGSAGNRQPNEMGRAIPTSWAQDRNPHVPPWVKRGSSEPKLERSKMDRPAKQPSLQDDLIMSPSDEKEIKLSPWATQQRNGEQDFVAHGTSAETRVRPPTWARPGPASPEAMDTTSAKVSQSSTRKQSSDPRDTSETEEVKSPPWARYMKKGKPREYINPAATPNETDVKSPSWAHSAELHSPDSPSRKILDEVKARRAVDTSMEERSPEQRLVDELAQDKDEARVVTSYGGAIIETPTPVNVASLRSTFDFNQSEATPRSRPTTPTRRTKPSWVRETKHDGFVGEDTGAKQQARESKAVPLSPGRPASRPGTPTRGLQPLWARERNDDGFVLETTDNEHASSRENKAGPRSSNLPSARPTTPTCRLKATWIRESTSDDFVVEATGKAHSSSRDDQALPRSSNPPSARPQTPTLRLKASWGREHNDKDFVAENAEMLKEIPHVSGRSTSARVASSSRDSSVAGASQPSWAKQGAASNKADPFPSRQQSWADRREASEQQNLPKLPHPSQAKPSASQQRKSSSEHTTQPPWKKASSTRGQWSQVKSPSPAWANRGASAGKSPPTWISKEVSPGELSSMQSPKSSWANPQISADRTEPVRALWVKHYTLEREFSPIQSPELPKREPSRGQVYASPSGLPAWVHQDASQDVSSIHSPPLISTKKPMPSHRQLIAAQTPPPSWVNKNTFQEGELSPIQSPPVGLSAPAPAHARQQQSQEESLENDELIPQTSRPKRFQRSLSPQDASPAPARARQQQSQEESLENDELMPLTSRPRRFQRSLSPQDASDWLGSTVDVNEGEGFSSEASRDMDNSMLLIEKSADLSRDTHSSDTNPTPEPLPFSSPSKSLAEMAADSVFALDYDLLTAQGIKQDSFEDEESLLSNGIAKAIPPTDALPEELKASLEHSLNRSAVNSAGNDDSRAYEADYFSTSPEKTVSTVGDRSGSTWDSRDISACSGDSSSVPRLSPSKKDTSPSKSSSRLTRRVLNFPMPAPVKESHASPRTSNMISEMNLETDDDARPNPPVADRIRAMRLEVDDDDELLTGSDDDDDDDSPSAVFGDPKTFEQVPSITERSKALEGWSASRRTGQDYQEEPFSRKDDSRLFISFNMNESSIDRGNPADLSIQAPPESPRQRSMVGTSPALASDSPPEDLGGLREEVRFGDPKSFGAAGGEVAEELPAPSVVHRGQAIEQWNGGRQRELNNRTRAQQHRQLPLSPSSLPRNSKSPEQQLKYYSQTYENALKAEEAHRYDQWAKRDPDILRTSPSPEALPEIADDKGILDAPMQWPNEPPSKMKPRQRDPFLQDDGDPFATSHIESMEFAAEQFQSPFHNIDEEEEFDFDNNNAFSPYAGDLGGAFVEPTTKRNPRLTPSPRDRKSREASAERYDDFYAQQAITYDPKTGACRLEI